jgi:hypothetical protein
MIAGSARNQSGKGGCGQSPKEQLESFGLNDPHSTAEFTYNENGAEESCLLWQAPLRAKPSNLMREGRPVIYQVSKGQSALAGVGLRRFCQHQTANTQFGGLASVSIAAAGKAGDFDLAGEQDSLKVTCGLREPVGCRSGSGAVPERFRS